MKGTKQMVEPTIIDQETGLQRRVRVDGEIDGDAIALTRAIHMELGKVEPGIDTGLDGIRIEADSTAGRWRTIVWNWTDGCDMPVIFILKQVTEWA